MPNTGGLLYAIGTEGTSWVKIGYTRGDVDTRLKALQTGHPQPLYVVGTVQIKTNVRQVEQHIHASLASVKQRGEWFELPMNAAMFKAMVWHIIPKTMGDTLGARIRRWRLAAGMSQAELARRIRLSPTAMHNIEKGTSDPRFSHVCKIADVLQLSLDTLREDDHHNGA